MGLGMVVAVEVVVVGLVVVVMGVVGGEVMGVGWW